MDTIEPLEIGCAAECKVADGRIYGVGAADCKGGLAAQVFVGALLRRSLLPLRGNIVVAATVAEEEGRSAGVRFLMERTLPSLGMKPSFAVLGEPTGLGLYYGHDGWMEVNVVLEGSNPFHVDDAAKAIYKDMGIGRTQFGSLNQQSSIQAPSFETIGGCRRATIPVSRRLNWGEDEGGVMNQIKSNATMIAKGSGSVAVEVMVRKETKRLYNGQQTVVQHVTHAWSIDPYHPLMSRARHSLAAASVEVRTGKWQLGRLGMGTAGGILVKDFQTPTIGYGPGCEEQAHAINEYVKIESVVDCLYGTAAMVHGLVGIPVCGWTSDEI
jgi:acetylornithine deacetylase/succinyl-diaminopimelate desuccinylase-like protein